MNKLTPDASKTKRGEPMKLRKRTLASVILALFLLLAFISVFPVAAVELGEKAPGFELPSTKGGNLSLSSFLGKKNVVIQFYVLDFSPG